MIVSRHDREDDGCSEWEGDGEVEWDECSGER